MAEIGKNTVQPIVKRKGQILKTVSSPSTSGSKKQVTNIVLDNGVLKASSDNGDTFEDITVKTAQNAQTENAYEIASLVLSDISKTQFKSNTVTATAAIDTSEIVHIASVDTSGLDPALQPYVEGLVNLGGITLYRTSERGFSATFGSVTDVDIRQGLTGSYVLSFIGDETKTYQLFGTVLSDSTGSGISAIFDNAGNPISATYAKKTEVNAKYTKPSGGIPKNDLASAVQTSLGKADTALQSVPIATSTKVGGVKPASKNTEMTQPVGVDSNGALWTAPGGGGGGTNVVANPSAAGTEDLLKLQVENTVYNIPATEIVFSTDAASGAAEVSGFSVEGQNFAFNLQNNNCVIGKTISNPTTGITYIKCTLSGTVSAAGNYFFVNCSGTLTVSGTSAKLFVTGSPSLTISGITSVNWRNVYIDGEASYIARNSNININLNSTVTVASGIKDSKEEKYELLLSIPDNGAHYIVGRGGTTYISPNYDGAKTEFVQFTIDSSNNLKCNPQFGESYFIVTWVRFSRRLNA